LKLFEEILDLLRLEQGFMKTLGWRDAELENYDLCSHFTRPKLRIYGNDQFFRADIVWH